MLGFLGINHCSDNIRREKVRGELYSAEFGINRRSECVDCQGFCQSRHTFEKYVSVREKPYEKVLNELFLAHYDLVHFHRESVHEGTFPLNAVVELFNVYAIHIFCFFNIFLVYICLLIGHIRPVCSLFEYKSILKNLIKNISLYFLLIGHIRPVCSLCVVNFAYLCIKM